jgi:8-oxo-dGTP pyrophosphatase MutT (NUDIX family)
MSIVEPKPASTVLLLRDGERGVEVFMVRRHDSVAFMGGAHVFPGGRVEDVDRVSGDDPHLVAAVRELFEEAGVRVAIDALVPWAHWVTPPIEARRFDTRFFAARAPANQTPAHDGQETTEGAWMTASDALRRAGRDDILLPPPTWTSLRELEPFTTVGDALQWARQRRIVRREPKLLERDGHRVLFIPGDPENPEPLLDMAPRETRFVFAAGRWRPMQDRQD